MAEISRAVRAAREARNWSQERLAREASKLPGAPTISMEQVAALECGRGSVRFNRREPLPYIFKTLGLSGEVVLRDLGLAS
jgi:transcriptional regulator with XRE-family HTH domain